MKWKEFKVWSESTETAAPESAEPKAEAKPEGNAEGEAKAAPKTESKPEPWYEVRIRQLTAKAKAAEERAAAAAAKPEATAEVKPEAKGIDTETRAQQIVAEREFNNTCDAIWETGNAEHKDFGSKIENFKKLGGLPPTLIEAAIEAGNAHKILSELGSNPDEAARIMNLSPLKMAVAISRLGDKLAKGKPVSQVDEPMKSLGSRSAASRDAVDPDSMPLTQWMAWREKELEGKRR